MLTTHLLLGCFLLGSPCLGAAVQRQPSSSNSVAATSAAPTAQVRNGSYHGLYSPEYDQDFFLGIPYSQPPVGDLRFRQPQPLNTTWSGLKNATEYSYECVGYGTGIWILGNHVSEDCLSLNVIRPAGVAPNASLPVAVWIHGGGLETGGNADPRYNLSFIVERSVKMGTPMIAVGINYRLSLWGFLGGSEMHEAGVENLGFRDQRLALHWVNENIAGFGGDPAKVVIWGESAGANSVGNHLIAFGGRDDGLFRGAITESGGPVLYARYPNVTTMQTTYDSVVRDANCSAAADTLACLRAVPTWTLSGIFNGTSGLGRTTAMYPVVDGDFLQTTGSHALRAGRFVRVPFLTGTNFDEGATFATKGINTTAEFLAMVKSGAGVDNATARRFAELYPDVPAEGIPATLEGRPTGSFAYLGAQWKRVAAFAGDYSFHASRRASSHAWARAGVPTWAYRFNVQVNGVSAAIGADHFEEVAFVMDNVRGNGYTTLPFVNPFAGKPATFAALADMMSGMWVSFVTTLDPNGVEGVSNTTWPAYDLARPRDIVFDVNVTGLAYVEDDLWRREQIAWLMEMMPTVLGM